MARMAKVDFKELAAYAKSVRLVSDRELDKLCEDCSKELAGRLLALVIPKTPVGKRPKLAGGKSVKVKGKSGKSKSFLNAQAAYWSGYNGGTLRRGWIAETADEAANGGGNVTASAGKEYAKSLPVTKSGNMFTVEVKNPVPYASYVEYGHRQEPGRFVPAIGKQLKASWVNGKYMMTISEEKLKTIAPSVLERLVKRKLEEFFNGGN